MPHGAPFRIDVTRTHLELRSPGALRPAPVPSSSPTLRAARTIGAAEYRKLYSLVGAQWFWRDRLLWTDEELDAHLAKQSVQVWVLEVERLTAGYFELQQHPNGAVEVMYFGLAPDFMGQGLGGWLLTRAVQEAFALGGTRVILNTCTLDAPQALPNYLARGFTIVREERYLLDVPDREAPAGTTGAKPRPAT
ncbi:MAG TPA: GNAT family N-acetyltransferase [Gemmatimonadaceae bacterium]|nr:GNAT family N-acetyltransferase [Gemmatimonadaceae bacterium]